MNIKGFQKFQKNPNNTGGMVFDLPNDISTVPAEFFKRQDLQGSPIINDKEEMQHFRTVVGAFLNYKVDALRDVGRMERDFSNIDNRFLDYLQEDYNFK
jgi:hypothetical protein